MLIPRRILTSPFRARAFSTSPASGIERVKLNFEHHAAKGVMQQQPPIIFMHGLFGSKANNRTVSKFLAQDLKRDIYNIDLRNHGDSPHAPRHDYVSMAEDVKGFIQEHGLEAPTLIGHSMGAKVAMTLALDQPSLISDFVSVDNAPVDAILSRNFGKYVRGMREIEEAGLTKRSEADDILKAYEPSEPVRLFLLGNLIRVPDANGKDVFKFRIPLDILGKNLDYMGDFPFRNPDERRFEKPALFIRGTKSAYVPDEVIPVIGRFFPLFQMADIDAGHWVISESPVKFFEAVKNFLTPKE